MQHIAQGGKLKYKRNDDLTFLLHKADLLEGLATVLHIAQGGKFKYKRNDDLTFLLHKADLLEGLAAVLHIAEEVVGTPCSPQSSDERAPDHRFF